MFLVDPAHFRADALFAAEMGDEARTGMVGLDQSQVREKACYYSAVCLESFDPKWMALEGSSNSRALLPS